MKKIFLILAIYFLLRILFLYIFNSEKMINDIGNKGTLIIFIIIVIIEICIILIPFIFKNLLIILFDKNLKIYFYFLLMLIIHNMYYIFLPNTINIVYVYFFEIILIVYIFFLLNNKIKNKKN